MLKSRSSQFLDLRATLVCPVLPSSGPRLYHGLSCVTPGGAFGAFVSLSSCGFAPRHSSQSSPFPSVSVCICHHSHLLSRRWWCCRLPCHPAECGQISGMAVDQWGGARCGVYTGLSKCLGQARSWDMPFKMPGTGPLLGQALENSWDMPALWGSPF